MRKGNANTPVSTDVQVRETFELGMRALAERDGTMALEAWARTHEHRRAGYAFVQLAGSDGVAPKPVRLRARYEGRCAACEAPIAIDDPVWWTRGVKGVECNRCGGPG